MVINCLTYDLTTRQLDKHILDAAYTVIRKNVLGFNFAEAGAELANRWKSPMPSLPVTGTSLTHWLYRNSHVLQH
jgi:hypothetical protein